MVGVVAGGREKVSATTNWMDIKAALREAARVASRRLWRDAELGACTEDLAYRSMARAVMNPEISSARRLRGGVEFARGLMHEVDGRFVLRDPAEFATGFEAARRAALEDERESLQKEGRRGRSRRQAVQRLVASWAPSGRRLMLVGTGGS